MSVTRRVTVLIAATIALTAALAACGVDADVAVERSRQLAGPTPTSEPDNSTSTTDPSDPPTTEPSDPTGPTSPPRPVDELFDEGNDKPERSYDDLVRNTVADLDGWWSAIYPEIYGDEYESLQGGVFPAYPDRENDIPGCGSASNTTYEEVQQYAAFYCSFGDFIVYDDGDNSLLLTLTEDLGDSVIAVVLAHEWGHAIQTRNGTFEEGHPTIYTEQQADCFAGAWTKRAVDGDIEGVEFTDEDVRAGLVAMIQVRDPLGFDQLEPGGHGSGFDRVGAFSVGFREGAARCSELIDSPLPLVPNKWQGTGGNQQTGGNAPWGYEASGQPAQVPGFLPTDLNRYWRAYFESVGREFPALQIQPVDGDDEVDCADISGTVELGAAFCPSDNTVYFDEQFARKQYDELGDFTVGYLLGTAWSEAAQQLLDSPIEDEPRALLSDCLTGTWVNDIILEEGEVPESAYIEPGDLDEAILTMLIIGDDKADDNVIGSGFEKIEAFRDGALNDVSACQDRLEED